MTAMTASNDGVLMDQLAERRETQRQSDEQAQDIQRATAHVASAACAGRALQSVYEEQARQHLLLAAACTTGHSNSNRTAHPAAR